MARKQPTEMLRKLRETGEWRFTKPCLHTLLYLLTCLPITYLLIIHLWIQNLFLLGREGTRYVVKIRIVEAVLVITKHWTTVFIRVNNPKYVLLRSFYIKEKNKE